MKKVLFVCVHNSGRSQMAEALFNHYAAGKAQAFSAGTQPASHVNPTVVEAMREVGIDISPQRPKKLTLEMLDDADKVVTMGCGVESVCPAAFVPTEEWQLEDPEGKPIEKVREIRGEIEAKVKKLIEQIKQERR
jgi:arsenate reductase